jgi:hypothetical protein
MPDADLNRIIAELERRRKMLDELIAQNVTSTTERERLQRASEDSAGDSSDPKTDS